MEAAEAPELFDFPETEDALQNDFYTQASEPLTEYDERFADEKFVAHRKMNEYCYHIYVQPAQPYIQDALHLLNMITAQRRYPRTELKNENDPRSIRIRKGYTDLVRYAYKNCGLLKPFFYRSKNRYLITGVFIYKILCWEEITPRAVYNEILQYSDVDLFCELLSHHYSYMQMPHNILRHVLENRERFYLYMDGAAYTPDIKEELILLYEACNVSDPEKESLRGMLIEFLAKFFEEFCRQFELVRDIAEEDVEAIRQELLASGAIKGITEDFVFRNALMSGEKEKIVCVKKLTFTYLAICNFRTNNSIVICLGHGYHVKVDDVLDYERLGTKLKNFTDVNAVKILDIVSQNPCNLEKLTEVTGMNKDAVYRLTAILKQQKILVQNDETNEFVLDREHLMEIIKLLEKYGGMEV